MLCGVLFVLHARSHVFWRLYPSALYDPSVPVLILIPYLSCAPSAFLGLVSDSPVLVNLCRVCVKKIEICLVYLSHRQSVMRRKRVDMLHNGDILALCPNITWYCISSLKVVGTSEVEPTTTTGMNRNQPAHTTPKD